jgi:hypothetical protein
MSTRAPVGVYTEGAGGRPRAADAAREIENGKLKMEKQTAAHAAFFNFQFSIFNSTGKEQPR